MIPSQIKIIRLETNDICTTGVILINGRMISLSLEPPKYGNTSDFSCIPSDSYKYIKRYSNKHNYEIIELSNVYKRSYIQIHLGNRPDQTSGCILPGLTIQTYVDSFGDDSSYMYLPRIRSSKPALDLLLSLTTPTGVVTITEQF